MAIALADSVTNTGSAVTSIAGTLPGGAPASGSVIVAVIVGDATGQTIVNSDGLAFRRIRLQSGVGTTFFIGVRVAGGSESATYTFRRGDSGSDNFSANLTVWTGCNRANPCFDADSFATASSDTIVIPAFTTALANVVVVSVLGIPSTTTVLTPPSGYTLASEIDGFNPGSSVYYVAQAVAGTTGTITWVTAASASSLKGQGFALRPDSGYSYAQGIVGAAANTDNAGANAWGTPTNAQAEDGTSTTCTVNGTTNQDFLDGTTLGFSIPSGATIKGYEVLFGFRLRSGGTTGAVRDGVVQLLDGAAAVGSSKALTTAWPIDATHLLYGSPDDLWGTTLADTDINDSGFGARLSIRGVAAGADRVGSIDWMDVTVYYTSSSSVGVGLTAGVLLEKRRLVS